MNNFTIKPEDVDFVLPSFSPGELENVNSVEFTRNIILELIEKLEKENVSTDIAVEQLNIAIEDYIKLLEKYGDVAPKLIGAQLLLEELVYKLQELLDILSLQINQQYKINKIQDALNKLLNLN